MLLNTAKGAWQQTGKKKLSYVFDNGERAFLDIADKFYYEDMDVFVSDTSKDLENIQKLQQLIQPAMQNGASLLEAAEILTNDNFNIIKQKLAAMQKRQEEQAQQQQQAEAQAQQQLQQMQNEAKQQELMLQEAQMDLDRYKIDQDNATKITVAEISAYRGTEDKDANQNGIPDPMEIAKDATT
nr:MAG: portal protein [Bacteriophage sp.]DAO10537.1 MAG TPA: portal protein [Bacteriophage sp.]